MPKLDKAKEMLALLKLWISVIVGAFIALGGWIVNRFIVDENVLFTLSVLALVSLLIAFFVLMKKITKIINEIGEMKK